MTAEEFLDILPDKIILPNDNPTDEWDDEDWYVFNLTKRECAYELSYTCWLKDRSLVSFSGSLYDVAQKMHQWCMEKGYY